MSKKALLMILDGWGIGDQGKDDVIFNTPTPYWDSLLANYPHSELQASGENVGLPDGQMGNSEVGHLNIGAGRIVYQDLVKINRACADNSIMKNPEIVSAFSYAKENGKNIHFMGLTSNGGVHSSFDHLFKLCDISKEYGIENTFIHCFMDGRDTDPKSGKGFIEQLAAHCEKSAGKIASIVGRFYAMDRDKRWERVKEAYDLLVEGKGKQADDMVQAMQESYDEGVTDEFIKPIHNSTVDGTIKEGDVVIFFNYRNDRAKELTVVLTQQDMPEQGMHTIPGLQFYCMTPYDASFKGVHILFDKENVQNTLGEYLAANGKAQLHIAETEKYAHVTFFFNGGRETPYDAEERILVPSPKVATYDLKPEMSAYEVKDKLVEAINTRKFDFIVVNYANGDMVGHTGMYGAIEKAVKAIDECVKDTVEAAKANDYEVIIIADHGNADHALNEDGTPNTAHSLNPVPFVYVTENKDAKVEFPGATDIWGFQWVMTDVPGAKEYFDGFFKYYHDMGVDFIRIDFLSWYEKGISRGDDTPVSKGYGRERYARALNYIAENAKKYGMFVSLVMPHNFEDAELEKKYGHMVRIDADTANGGWWHFSESGRGTIYNSWPNSNNMFDGFVYWSHISGRERIILDGDFTRLNTFENDAQKRSVISLQLMAGGPISACDTPDNMGENIKFYTNTEMLALNADHFCGKPVSDKLNDSNNQIWYGQMSNGDWIIGMFNRDNAVKSVKVNFWDFGINGEMKIRDIWTHQDEGVASSLSINIPPYDCKIIKLTK